MYWTVIRTKGSNWTWWSYWDKCCCFEGFDWVIYNLDDVTYTFKTVCILIVTMKIKVFLHWKSEFVREFHWEHLIFWIISRANSIIFIWLFIQGRKELLSFLNRRRYKEMMLAPLEKKHLRLSPLDMRFHLRDLIGSGHVKTVHTPTGLVVRVSKD